MNRRARRVMPARGITRANDEGAALIFVLMVMLVIAGLAIMIISAVVSQVRPTLFSTKNSQTVYAAETGLQVALSQLRTAAESPGAGAPSQLPCSLTGTVGSTSGLTYSVGIQYFSSNPTAESSTWRTQHALPCSDTTGLSVSPSFALFTAKGLADGVVGLASTAGDRTITSMYVVKTTDANISGGLLYTWSQKFCAQADTATIGSLVHYVAAVNCVSSSPLQTWQWDTDYRIRLTSSLSPGPALCLTGSYTNNQSVTLTACSATRYDQLFSYEGFGRFRGQNADNSDYGTTCLWANMKSTSLAGATLTSGLTGCDSQDQDWGSWAAEPKFGAGGAGANTSQLVNYAQFGRCFDVTVTKIDAKYMIIYPCKQDPTGKGGFLWNQKFSWIEPTSGYSVTQTITVTEPTKGVYCLTSPAKGASPAYPTFTKCVAGASNQQWVRTKEVPGNSAASYTITDALGRCLSPGPLWTGGTAISSAIVADCNGGGEQKWDAPANLVDAAVTNVRETIGGS